MRAHARGKTLAIILDNASIHKAKSIKKFIEKHKDIHLFALPTYSPEYNPTEQFWKWIKPLVHGAKSINGGIKELLSRFRKIMHARINQRLINPPNIGIGIWNSFL